MDGGSHNNNQLQSSEEDTVPMNGAEIMPSIKRRQSRYLKT